MSDTKPTKPYVYQPFGVQHRSHWGAKRIYGIGGLNMLARIEGLTKAEATAIVEALCNLHQEERP